MGRGDDYRPKPITRQRFVDAVTIRFTQMCTLPLMASSACSTSTSLSHSTLLRCKTPSADASDWFGSPYLERTTDGKGLIHHQPYNGGIDACRTLKAPRQKIPTFDETMELLMRPENAHVVFNIDCKVRLSRFPPRPVGEVNRLMGTGSSRLIIPIRIGCSRSSPNRSNAIPTGKPSSPPVSSSVFGTPSTSNPPNGCSPRSAVPTSGARPLWPKSTFGKPATRSR